MWREITEDDVLTTLTAPEMAAFRTAAIGEDQEDPLPAVTKTAVGEARGYIAGCRTNVLEAGDTVPESMIHQVVTIIRYRLISRLPIRVREAREQEYKDARTYLRDVSICRVGIEQPAAGEESDASFPASTPTVQSRSRRFSRNHQDGI